MTKKPNRKWNQRPQSRDAIAAEQRAWSDPFTACSWRTRARLAHMSSGSCRVMYGEQARLFEDEIRPHLRHKARGMVRRRCIAFIAATGAAFGFTSAAEPRRTPPVGC